MREAVLDVDSVTEGMAPVVRSEVGAGEHGSHHVGEGAVGSFSNGVLEGGTGACGLKDVSCFSDALLELGASSEFATLVCPNAAKA